MKKQPDTIGRHNKLILFALMMFIAFIGVRSVNHVPSKTVESNTRMNPNSEAPVAIVKHTEPEEEEAKDVLVAQVKDKNLSPRERRKAEYVQRIASEIHRRLSNIEIKRRGSCDVSLLIRKSGRIGDHKVYNCVGGYSVRKEIESAIKKLGVLPAPRNEFYEEVKTIQFKVEGKV